MKPAIFFAGLRHETHTFLNSSTPLEAFEKHRGESIFDFRGSPSPVDGFLEVAEANDWQIVPGVLYQAMPGGIVEDEVVESFWADFLDSLHNGRNTTIDAVFLFLHGAMVSRSFPDVEGELLSRIRRVPGLEKVPIFGILDLHCNFTEKMARLSDCLVTYRKNPHTDARATAIRAAHLLRSCLTSGSRPKTIWRQTSIVLNPSATATAEEPMKSLEKRARWAEAQTEGLEAANVFAGYAYSDMADCGVSFSLVSTGSSTDCAGVLDDLENLAWERKDKGPKPGLPLEDALALIEKKNLYPAVVVESADNIGGGAPGDLTLVLKEMLKFSFPSIGSIINDPEAVQKVLESPLGATVELAIGGKSGVIGAESLPLKVRLVSTSNGRFQLEDPHSHLAASTATITGKTVGMGPCAVVQHKNATILLTSRKTPPFDLGQWRSQGIEPERLGVIHVKAAVAHRQAYDKIARLNIEVDTPGPCANNLKSLPYNNIRRPVWPLDHFDRGQHD